MTSTQLSGTQTNALIYEMTSTRSLLAYGIKVTHEEAFWDSTKEPIMTMLSIGVEKLYKLTIGVVAIADGGTWPTKSQMRAYGHNLVELHRVVVRELRERTDSRSAYVQGLVSGLGADPVVIPLIEALSSYGQMGRFYYLDQLAGSQQAKNPVDLWGEIEAAVFNDQKVAELYRIAMADSTDNEAWANFHKAFRSRIADSIDRLWFTVAICGQNQALGVWGVHLGTELLLNDATRLREKYRTVS